MKRQSGNVSLAVLMRNAVRPDEEEICAFVDATHATPASCKGSKIQFVDGKPTISLQGRKTKTNQIAPSSCPPRLPPQRQAEGQDDEEELERTHGSETCAGVFEFQTAGIKYGAGCIGRYLCIDMSGDPDMKHADGMSLKAETIPTAFVHLRISARSLRNMDGPFGKSDPFYTITRVATTPDPQSGEFKRELVYKSPVITDDLNPRWPKARIPLNKLGRNVSLLGGDDAKNDDSVLEVAVWDKDQLSEDDLIGSARVALHDIAPGLELPLALEKRGGETARNSRQDTHNGVLVFEKSRVELKYYKLAGPQVRLSR
jgi:hypothetical protein